MTHIKIDYLTKENKNRKAYVHGSSEEQIREIFPWIGAIKKVNNGLLCFEYFEDLWFYSENYENNLEKYLEYCSTELIDRCAECNREVHYSIKICMPCEITKSNKEKSDYYRKHEDDK